jgi:hypothetical protein
VVKVVPVCSAPVSASVRLDLASPRIFRGIEVAMDSTEKLVPSSLSAGVGTGFGIAIGVALGFALNKLALGIALGAAFGAALDVTAHVRKKKRS